MMSEKTGRKLGRASFAVVGVLLAHAVPAAVAQTASGWKGANGATWNNSANWANGIPGTNGANGLVRDLYFNDGNATGFATSSNDITAGLALFRVTFNPSAVTTTITGNAVEFYDFGGIGPQIQNNSGVAQNFNLAMKANDSTGSARFAISPGSGSLSFGGTLQLGTANNTALTVLATNPANGATNSGNVTFSNVISQGSGFTGSVVMSGSGVMTLSGANTFSGGVTVNSGTLSVGGVAVSASGSITTSATGTGDVSLASGTSLANASGTTWAANNITLGSTLNYTSSNRLNIHFKSLTLASGGTTINIPNRTMVVTGGNTTTPDENTGRWGWETNSLTGGSTPYITGGSLSLATTQTGTNYAPMFFRATNFGGNNLTVGQNVVVGLSGSLSGGTITADASAAPIVTVNAGGIVNLLNANKSIGLLAGGGSVYATMLATNSGNFTLTLTNATSTTQTFSGLIANGPASTTLALSKTGANAVQVLSGTNTYSGGTTLSAGTLRAANVQAFGIGGLSLGGGTIDLATDASINAYNTTVTANATVQSNKATASSAGITHTLGTLSIGAQTLSVASGANVASNSAYGLTFGATTLSGNATFDVANNGTGAGTLTLGAVGGNFNLTKTNSGVLALRSASLRTSGSTVISGGTIRLGDAAALGSVGTTLTLNGGTLDLAIDTTVNAYNTTINTGTSTVTAGRATAGSGITHTLGTLTIGAQTLNVAAGSNVTSNTSYGLTWGATTLSGNATFDVANNGTGAGTLTLGALGGNFNLTKSNAGVLVLPSAGSRTSGSTVVSAGTLRIGDANALGSAATTLTLGGGTLDLMIDGSIPAMNTTASGASSVIVNKATANSAGVTQTLGTLAASSTLSISAGSNVAANTAYGMTFGATTLSGTPVFDVANNGTGTGTLTLNTLSGNVGFSKQGGGTLSLVGTSTRTGGFTLFAGTTQLSASGALGAAGATVNLNGGTLALLSDATVNAHNTTVGGDATILSGRATAGSGITHTLGTLAIGANTLSVGAGSNVDGNADYGLTFGATTLSGNATVVVSNNGTGTGTTTLTGVVSGAFGLTKQGAGTLVLSNTGSTYSGPLVVSQGTLSIPNPNAVSANGPLGNSTTAVSLASNGSTGTLLITGTNATYASSKPFTLVNGGTGAFNINNAGTTVTFSGLIDGGGSLQKAGAGTAIISGANTYAGGTTVSQGTFIVGVDSVLAGSTITTGATGTGDLTLVGGTTLSASGGRYLAVPNLRVNGNVTIGATGSGRLSIDGTWDLGGATRTITLGRAGSGYASGQEVFRFGNSNTVNTGTPVVKNTGGDGLVLVTSTGDNTSGTPSIARTLLVPNFDSNAGLRIGDGVAYSSGNGNMFGTGTNSPALVLDAPSTRGGGVLQMGDGISGVNAVVRNAQIHSLSGGGTVSSSNTTGNLTTGTLTINNGAGATFSGVITEAGGTGRISVTKSGAGTQTFSGTNSYTGVTTISGGTLSVSTINNGDVAGNLGQASNAAANLVLSGGTLAYTGAGESNDRAFTLSASTSSTISVAGSATLAMPGATGAATTGAFTKAGTGTFALTGTNTNTGTTTISGGTLQIGNGGTSGSLGTGNVTNNGTLAFNRTDSYGGAVANVISGSGAVSVAGGALTLSGANTYVGSTTVSAGSLLVTGSLTGAGSSVTVASGASLFTEGGGTSTTISRAIVVNGTIAPGNDGSANTVGTVNLSGGNLTLAGATLFDLNTQSTSGGDLVTGVGTLDLGGSIDFNFLGGGQVLNAYGTRWPLINYASRTGSALDSISLSGLPSLNNSLAWGLTESSNSGVLTLNLEVVPEPTTIGAAALIGVQLLRRRRASL